MLSDQVGGLNTTAQPHQPKTTNTLKCIKYIQTHTPTTH